MLAPMRAALHAATYAAILGLACGGNAPKSRPLPKAGDANDDGSGALARASRQFLTSTDESGFEPEVTATAGGYGYEGGYYGYGYGSGHTYGGFGGDAYGGSGYGGTLYGGYQIPYAAYTPPRTPDYTINYNTAAEGGAVVGAVRWPKPPAHDARLAVAGCGTTDNPSVVVGDKGAAVGAVVYLEGVKSGRAWIAATYGRQASVGGVIEVQGCAIGPRVQLHGPLPGQIQIHNLGGQPVRVVGERPADGSFQRLDGKVEVGGSRLFGVSTPGFSRFADDAGAMPPAWVISQDHPYYTLTDADGRFRLDDVVPGDYTLVVWHPPVVTTIKDGAAVYGDPVVVRKKVTVKKTAATKVAVEL